MRRLTTLSVLAFFAPIMCGIAFAFFTVLEIRQARRRTAKYRSGLPRSIERSLQQQLDDDIRRMIHTGETR